MTDLTICPREGCTATERHWHWHDDPTKNVWPCSFLPGPCKHVESSYDSVACHEPRPQADLTEPVDLPTAEELAKVALVALLGVGLLAVATHIISLPTTDPEG